MASKDTAVLFFWVGLSLIVWYTDKIAGQNIGLMCEPSLGESYCQVTEGDVAWFFTDVQPEGEGEDFETSLLFTRSGLHGDTDATQSQFQDSDEAQPVLDYGPIVVENIGDYFGAYELEYIPVEVVDDCDLEKKETFHTVIRSEPYYPQYEEYRDVIILDNDDAYKHKEKYYQIMETVGKVEFEVCREADGVLAAGKIAYETIPMTAVDSVEQETNGERDFIKTSGTLEYSETDLCKSGTVEIISDLNTLETAEEFGIDIEFIDPSATGCTGKVIEPSRAVVTIHDAETSLFSIEFCDYSVTEPDTGSLEFKFKIMREGNTAFQSDIVFTGRAVSATNGKDYQLPNDLTVRFEPNSDTVEASITIESDDTVEDPETFELSISKPISGTTSGIIIEPSKAIVTIHDFTSTKSCGSFDSSVIVVFESDGRVMIKVRREGNLEARGTIDIMTTNVDASDSTDYDFLTDTLLFNIGQKETTVYIPITNDLWKEDSECFKVTLSTPNNGDNPMDVCAPECTNVMIKDDDDQFYFDGVYYRVFEDDGIVEINIIRVGYLGTTSYAYVTSAMTPHGNTADANDYNIKDNGVNRVVFLPNERTKTLQIDITTNDGYEGEEEFFVMLEAIGSSPAVSPQQIGVPNKATIVIYDDFVCSPPCVNGECVHENICECPPSFTGILCQTAVKVISASYTIVESPPGVAVTFTDTLYDRSSTDYIELEQKNQFELEQAYSSLPLYLGVEILGFTPGSIKVDYLVRFAAESDSSLADVSQMFAEAINSNAVLGDSDLKLSPSDIDCPIGYCQNGGMCATTDTSYFCECTDGFSGVQCSTPIFDPSTDGDGEGGAGGGAGGSSQMSDGTIVAIIIGSMFLLFLFSLLACVLVWMLRRRRRILRKQEAVVVSPQQQIELRPYDGINPPYVLNNGFMGTQPLY